ncbi:hypothetical protein HYH02_001246 [Chlamydomonas schloesseri]|uniref:Uncharacterized protein n=1 Tax=Chlamydomonas schloesseri TaxID=2026947 RepID=A0A835WUH1_9CHLO|nr:hypothetical protein HYH02_001246 [Chlamydomonas schloesseri]|eukprot:KAG2454212.1 hypothetical protein HYH02_001246 [Chlamydomonas schloesseri]
MPASATTREEFDATTGAISVAPDRTGIGAHGGAAPAAESAPFLKLPAAALGALAAAGAAASGRSAAAARRSSFDATAASTGSRKPHAREQTPRPHQHRGRWLVTYVDLTWGTTGRMYADAVIVATGGPRPEPATTPAARTTQLTQPGGIGGGGGGCSQRALPAGAVPPKPTAALPASCHAATAADERTGASGVGSAGISSAHCTRFLAAPQATAVHVERAARVTVIGQGVAARDAACAAALLRQGEGVSVRAGQLPDDLLETSACHPQIMEACIDASEHEGLLSSARRRALAASLQPHYAAPQPGPLAKVLRAPAKRRFWALVKDKLALCCGGGGGSGGSSSGGEHLVLWAPSLHDPRFMPFLSAPLRQALLGGAGGDGDLTLYRGMVHPDVPGLAFVGLEAHAGSGLLLLELQAQWLAAHLAGQLALPSAAAMRADVAAQRAWRSGALAHPLMSAGGSLARRHEQGYLEQLREDLRGVGVTSFGEPPVPITSRGPTGGSTRSLAGGSRSSSPAVPSYSRRSSRCRGSEGRASLGLDATSAAAAAAAAAATKPPLAASGAVTPATLLSGMRTAEAGSPSAEAAAAAAAEEEAVAVAAGEHVGVQQGRQTSAAGGVRSEAHADIVHRVAVLAPALTVSGAAHVVDEPGAPLAAGPDTPSLRSPSGASAHLASATASPTVPAVPAGSTSATSQQTHPSALGPRRTQRHMAVVAEAMAAAAEASKAAAAAVAAAAASKAAAAARPTATSAHTPETTMPVTSSPALRAPTSPRAFRSFRVQEHQQASAQQELALRPHQTAPGEVFASGVGATGRSGTGGDSGLNARDLLRVGAVAAACNRRGMMATPGSPPPAAALRRSSKRALGWTPSFSRLSHCSRDEGDGGCSSSGGVGLDAAGLMAGWSSGGGSGRGGRSGRGSSVGGSGGAGAAAGAGGGYVEVVGLVQRRLRRHALRSDVGADSEGDSLQGGSVGSGGRCSSGSGALRHLDAVENRQQQQQQQQQLQGDHASQRVGTAAPVRQGSASSGRMPSSSAVFFQPTLGAAAAAAATSSSPVATDTSGSGTGIEVLGRSRKSSALSLPLLPSPSAPPHVPRMAQSALPSPPPPSRPSSPRVAAEALNPEASQLQRRRMYNVARKLQQQATAADDCTEASDGFREHTQDAHKRAAVSCATGASSSENHNRGVIEDQQSAGAVVALASSGPADALARSEQAAADAAASYARSVASASPFSTAAAPPSPPRTWHHQLFKPRPRTTAPHRLTCAAGAAEPPPGPLPLLPEPLPPGGPRILNVATIIREFQEQRQQHQHQQRSPASPPPPSPSPLAEHLQQAALLPSDPHQQHSGSAEGTGASATAAARANAEATGQLPPGELLHSEAMPIAGHAAGSLCEQSHSRVELPQPQPQQQQQPLKVQAELQADLLLSQSQGDDGSSSAAAARAAPASLASSAALVTGGAADPGTLLLLTAVTSDPEAVAAAAGAATEGNQLLISSGCSLVAAPSLTSMLQQPEPAVLTLGSSSSAAVPDGSSAAAAETASRAAESASGGSACGQGGSSSALPRPSNTRDGQEPEEGVLLGAVIKHIINTAPSVGTGDELTPSSLPQTRISPVTYQQQHRPRGVSEPLLKLPALPQALRSPLAPRRPADGTAPAASCSPAVRPLHASTRLSPNGGPASTSGGASPASPYYGTGVSSARAGRVMAAQQPFSRVSTPPSGGAGLLDDGDDAPLSPTTRRRQLAGLDSPTLMQLRQLLGLGMSDSGGPLPLLPIPDGSSSSGAVLGSGRQRGRSGSGATSGGMLSRRGSQQHLPSSAQQQQQQQKQRRTADGKAGPRRQLSSPTLQASGSGSGFSSSGGRSPAAAGRNAAAAATAAAAAAARQASYMSEGGAATPDGQMSPVVCDVAAVSAASAPVPCVIHVAAAAATGDAGAGAADGCAAGLAAGRMGASSAVPGGGCGVWAHRLSDCCHMLGCSAADSGSASFSANAEAAAASSGVTAAADLIPAAEPPAAMSAAVAPVADASAANATATSDAAASTEADASASTKSPAPAQSPAADTEAAAAAVTGAASDAGSKSAASSLELSLRTLVVNQHRREALHQLQAAGISGDLNTPALPPPSPSFTRPGSQPGAEAPVGVEVEAAPANGSTPPPVQLRLPGLTSTAHFISTAEAAVSGAVHHSDSSNAISCSGGAAIAGGASSSTAGPVAAWGALVSAAEPAPARRAAGLAGVAVGSPIGGPALQQGRAQAMPGSRDATAGPNFGGAAGQSVPPSAATPPSFARHSWQPLRTTQSSLTAAGHPLPELMLQPPSGGAHQQLQVRKTLSSSAVLLPAGGGGAAAGVLASVTAGATAAGIGTFARRGYSWGSGASSHGSSSGGGSSRAGSGKALLASTAEGQATAEARASIARAMAATAMFTSSRRILPVPEGCQLGGTEASRSLGYGDSSASAPLPVFARGSMPFQRRSASGTDGMGAAAFGSNRYALTRRPQSSSSTAVALPCSGMRDGSSATPAATASAPAVGILGDKPAPLRRRQLSLSSLLAAAGFGGEAACRPTEQPLRGLSGRRGAASTVAAAVQQSATATPQSCSPRATFGLPVGARGFHSDLLPLDPDSPPASAPQLQPTVSELGLGLGLAATVLRPTGTPAFCIRLQPRGRRGSSSMGAMLLPASAPVELAGDLFGDAAEAAAGLGSRGEGALNASSLLDTLLGIHGTDADAPGRPPVAVRGNSASSTGGKAAWVTSMAGTGQAGGAVNGETRAASVPSMLALQSPSGGQPLPTPSEAHVGCSSAASTGNAAGGTGTAAAAAATAALAAARQSVDAAAAMASGGDVDTENFLIITLMLMSRGGPDSTAHVSGGAAGDSATALTGGLGAESAGGGAPAAAAAATATATATTTAAAAGTASQLLSSAARGSFDFAAAAAAAVAAAAARPYSRTTAGRWRPAAGLAVPSEVDEHRARHELECLDMVAPSTSGSLRGVSSAGASSAAGLGPEPSSWGTSTTGGHTTPVGLVAPLRKSSCGMAAPVAASAPLAATVLTSNVLRPQHVEAARPFLGAQVKAASPPSSSALGPEPPALLDPAQGGPGPAGQSDGAESAPAFLEVRPRAQPPVLQAPPQLSQLLRCSVPQPELDRRAEVPPPSPCELHGNDRIGRGAGAVAAPGKPPKKGRIWSSLFGALRRHAQRKTE